MEAIAYGSDPLVRPGDRLRALELLKSYAHDGDDAFWEKEALVMTDEDAKIYVDLAQAEVVKALLAGDKETAAEYPLTADALR